MAEGLVLEEKRNLSRKELIYYLRVRDLLNSQELGRMVDIHGKGLLLMATKSLILEHEYLLGIEMPKALSEQGIPDISVRALAVWVRPSQTQPYLENGLMFVEPSLEAQASIEQLINMFALPGGLVFG